MRALPCYIAALRRTPGRGTSAKCVDADVWRCHRYADFLTKFGDALHAHGKVLTVDVASWSHIWNYSAIAASSVDRMMVMSTYAGASWGRHSATLVKRSHWLPRCVQSEPGLCCVSQRIVR